MSGQDCSLNLCDFWNKYAPSGSSLKMFPDFYLPENAETSELHWPHWTNAGMVWRGECLMLNISESPNDAVESSLLDILEDHVHRRFYLSPKAAAGILRRAEKRDTKLPIVLEQALQRLTRQIPTPTSSAQLQEEATPVQTKMQEADISSTSRPCPQNGQSVRRLTPTECERLQGFPDGWTILPMGRDTKR